MAGAIELATAYIALVPSLKGASQGISSQLTPASAAAGAEGGASLGSALMGGIKKFALPIAGIVAGLSVGKLVKDSVADFQSYQGAVNGFGRIAGGSITQFSGLRGAIQLSGVDVDAAAGGLTIFSKNLGNASGDAAKTAEMTKKLGTEFKDAAGNVKPMSDIMPGLADKFKSMPDGAEKTALAMQLFGRSGTQMLPFLNQGSEGIAKLTGQAGKMGLVLDETDKKIFGAAKSSLREYNTSIQGMHIALGSTALPILTAFSNVGRSVMIPVIQAMTQALSAARGPVLALATHVQAFADRVRAAMTGILTLFTSGDFTGGLSKALGIQEDSVIVGVILGIRDAFKEVGAGVHAMFAAYKAGDGDVTSSGFAGVMERIGNGARELTGGIHAMFAAFKAGDGDVTSSGFAGVMEKIGNAARGLFDQIGPAFSQLMSAIGPLVPQILSLVTSFSPLHLVFGAIAPVLPQIAAALGQLASAIGTSLGSALTTVVPVLSQLASTLVGTLGQAVQSILPSIVSLIPLVATSFAQLLPIIAGLITQLAPLVASLLPPLVGLFNSLIPVVVQLVSSVLPVAVQIISMLVQAVVPLVTILAAMLIPIIQALMPVVVVVFGVIAQVITTVMQIVQGIIQVVLGIISGNWSMVWDGIVNIFSGIWNTIVALVTGVLAILGSIISGALGGIGSFIGDILGNIGQFFADTWNNITNGISDFVGGIGRFFAGIPDAIMGALSGAGSWLFDAGKNIVEGLFNGIKSLAGTIGNFFLGLLPGWIVDPFKIALGIQSPSRVFRQFGRHIGEGLMLGTGDTKDDIGATMRGLVTVPDMPNFGAPSASIAGRGRGSGNTFQTTINQVDDPIGTAHAVTRRQLALSS